MTGQIPPRFRLASYGFRLPESSIAQVPAVARTGSRLLVLDRRTGRRQHAGFADLPRFLSPGDCLVLNDTRVMHARLVASKETGGRVELLVLRLCGRRFEAMYGARRGLKPGACLSLLDREGAASGLSVRVVEVGQGGVATVEAPVEAHELLAALGRVPLPPYIRRGDASMHAFDAERYQTVFAREEGAVAAPTAGLHFSEEMLAGLPAMGVEVARVTLHVGPGTFRPVKTEDVRLHDVGEEAFFVPEATACAVNRALAEGRRVVAVGTTVVRTLETAGAGGRVAPGRGSTRLLVVPGHRFRVVSAMLTNFHLPGSSLLLLVSAFAGRRKVLSAYREAVRMGYRFYSYGDAMLIA